jgi:POT family proton-dependent oligopeptide transporter
MRSFIANQYTDRTSKKITLLTPQNRSLKEELVVIDSDITLQYIYNLYFWIGNVGALSAFPCVYIEKHHGFASAYALGLGCIVIALLMLVFGRKLFGMQHPTFQR